MIYRTPIRWLYIDGFCNLYYRNSTLVCYQYRFTRPKVHCRVYVMYGIHSDKHEYIISK